MPLSILTRPGGILQGEVEKALDAFSTARELAPKDPVTVMNIGDCQLLLGRAEAAKQSYRQALELDESHRESDPTAYWGIRAQCLAHLGLAREAVSAVQEELQTLPDEPTVYFDTALVYTIIGDRTTAVVHAKESVNLGTRTARPVRSSCGRIRGVRDGFCGTRS